MITISITISIKIKSSQHRSHFCNHILIIFNRFFFFFQILFQILFFFAFSLQDKNDGILLLLPSRRSLMVTERRAPFLETETLSPSRDLSMTLDMAAWGFGAGKEEKKVVQKSFRILATSQKPHMHTTETSAITPLPHDPAHCCQRKRRFTRQIFVNFWPFLAAISAIAEIGWFRGHPAVIQRIKEESLHIQ